MRTILWKSDWFAVLAPIVLGVQVAPGDVRARVDTPPAARPTASPRADDPLAELVDTIGRRAIGEDGVPGLTIAVAQDGEIAVCRGFGYADPARGVTAKADTRWPIGSFAHPMTAVAVMQLVEAGKLSLGDDIAKLLPEFPAKQHELKLEHLLANTGGVPGWRKLHAKHPEVATRSMNAKELLALYADVPFDFEPGTAYSLDTTGYVLLGMILARSSGEPLAQHLKRTVAAPIGMMNTDVCPAEARPIGYAEDCKEILDDHDLAVPLAASPYAGDQALCSTAGDLALWVHSVFDENAFGEAATKALTKPAVTAAGEATGGSFAMTLGKLGDSAWYAHAGGVGGFRLRAAYYARTRTTVVVLANCASAQVDEFENEIACHVLGLPSPIQREIPLHADDIAACVGAYQIATTRVVISATDGKLYCEWPTGSPIELRHRGGLTFVFATEPETKLVFRVDGGKAGSFELTRSGLVSTGRRME